jgi:hypothetical protein
VTFETFQRRHLWRAIVAGEPIGFFSNPNTALSTARHEADEYRKHNSVLNSRVSYGFMDAQTGRQYDERGDPVGETAGA